MSEIGRQPRFNTKRERQKKSTGPRIKITPRKRQDVTPKPLKTKLVSQSRENSPLPLGDGPDVEVLDPTFQPPSEIPRGDPNFIESLQDLIVRARPVSSGASDAETLRSTEMLKTILINMTKLHSPEPEGHAVEHYSTGETEKQDSRKVIVKEGRQANKQTEEEGSQDIV
ncbi:MAG: hypothetical protein JAZ17_21980, partial [Candidatus Thiodiazotropha endolucinida]|nr:hypothetical protein [Candidatus Thiodiazotropha endolucinida]